MALNYLWNTIGWCSWIYCSDDFESSEQEQIDKIFMLPAKINL